MDSTLTAEGQTVCVDPMRSTVVFMAAHNTKDGSIEQALMGLTTDILVSPNIGVSTTAPVAHDNNDDMGQTAQVWFLTSNFLVLSYTHILLFIHISSPLLS